MPPSIQLPSPARLDDPDYWKSLLPDLNFTPGRPYGQDDLGNMVASPSALRHDVLLHGYHVGQRGVPFANELAAAVKSLARAGMHPQWLVLADELWLLTKWFQPLLEAAFPRLRLLADYYVFLVDPTEPNQRQGWAPHRDRVDMSFGADDRAPNYLTVWIALTDATPDNGCIYLVPASEDPDYFTMKPWQPPQDLQSIHAVPVAAGTPIFWGGRLLHWGGRAAPFGASTEPRIAFAFAAATAESERSEVEISGRSELPSLKERLQTVFCLIEKYKHRLPTYALYAQLRDEYRRRNATQRA